MCISSRRVLVAAILSLLFGLADVIALDKLTWKTGNGIHNGKGKASQRSSVHHHEDADRMIETTTDLEDLSPRRGLADGPVFFLATTNTNLTSTKIEDAFLRIVDSVDSMLRRTNAFKGIYTPGPAITEDETLPVKLIRGGAEGDFELNTGKSKVLSVQHGLISAVVDAYNNHLNLVLRPDDIWIAVLSQFASYVNGGNRAELLRQRFISHNGQEKLQVQAPGSIHAADFGAMTSSMLEEMRKHFVQSAMYEWFLPGFSTSTRNDDVCAAACAMCTTQSFFGFGFTLGCGIPEIILEGTVEDWQKLRAKMNQLKQFDAGDGELLTWVGFLEVIGENFVKSAAGGGSDENLEFWDTIAHCVGGASATEYLSGWITTFSYFSNDGFVTPTSLESETLAMSIDVMRNTSPKDAARFNAYEKEYKKWPIIDSKKLASGTVSCPVRIDDNGTPYEGRLFVGQMALNYLNATQDMKARATALNDEGKLRVIQPRNDWALAIEGQSLFCT